MIVVIFAPRIIVNTQNQGIKKIMAKRGRPLGKTYALTLQMRVNEKMLRIIDNWRSRQRPIPSRSEAVRQIVETVAEEKRA